MKARLLQLWMGLRTSYWFVPGLLAVAALALAMGLVSGDTVAQTRGTSVLGRFYLTGPEGARALLSTIAASAITVAALVFSITMVVLNMASAQFGPRLLTNFMRHNATQIVMGTFVGVFVYCLVVLVAVRSGDGRAFVPHTAVAVGLALAVVAFGLLIYLIHHISRFVQASHIIDDVARSLEGALRATFPERGCDGVAPPPNDEDLEEHPDSPTTPEDAPVLAARSGYVQVIDLPGLVKLASDRDVVIRLGCQAGNFVLQGRPVAWAAPADRVDKDFENGVADAILTAPERTSLQDPEFAVHQLVEIALRALSPGINDPHTAINCIDRLTAALCVLAERVPPSRHRRDGDGRLRLVTEAYSYRAIVDKAFDQIRRAASGHLAVLLRLLESIEALARGDLPESYREVLRDQVEAIGEADAKQFPTRSDRKAFDERVKAAQHTLSNAPPGGPAARRAAAVHRLS